MNKKPFILGVDPGLSGALAVLDVKNRSIVSVFDMPIIQEKTKRTIDCGALGLKLSAFIDDISFAVVEDVHSMPGQGVVGVFSFGVSKGIILGMLGLSLIPVFLTPPAVWKNVMGLNRDKDWSRTLATKLFPLSEDHFKLKKDHDKAESCLLAEFGRRFY